MNLVDLLKKNINTFPITDVRMTRFFINLPDAVKFVLKSMQMMKKGEIFISTIYWNTHQSTKTFKKLERILGLKYHTSLPLILFLEKDSQKNKFIHIRPPPLRTELLCCLIRYLNKKKIYL